MPVTYFNSSTAVLIGDHVEMKVWLFFWRGWQPGRVYYVPGISPKDNNLEHDGMRWVSIHDRRGSPVGVWVDPKTAQLKKSVRLVKRSDDNLTQTPGGYRFPDE